MSCWPVPNPSQRSPLTSDISLACANVYGTPGSHLLHRIETSGGLVSVLRREKSDKPESKKPRKLVSFQGFKYCESGGEEEARARFGSVSVRAKPTQYGAYRPARLLDSLLFGPKISTLFRHLSALARFDLLPKTLYCSHHPFALFRANQRLPASVAPVALDFGDNRCLLSVGKRHISLFPHQIRVTANRTLHRHLCT